MTPPNILYIHSHDSGRYVQPYGNDIPTPNMQRLAEAGVIFRQAFTPSPTCSPSRACLLTGQYAHNNGMLGLAHRGFRLNDYGHHIIHTLKQAGYTTALAGIQHIANSFEEPWKVIGYDIQLGEPSPRDAGPNLPDNNAETAAVDFLTNHPPQPFFLSVGFKETHRQFPALPDGENAHYIQPPALLPDTPEVREDMARFRLSARHLDQKMGQVIDTLERSDLSKHTLVICTTDHGIPFPRMKGTLTAAGTGVKLILRGLGGFSGGKVLDSLVSQIDIFPILCDILGIPAPDWLQGVSLMPLIRGETDEVRQEIFGEINFHAAYEPVRSVRTRRWSYIRRFDNRPYPILPNCDNSPGKQLWIESGWQGIAPDMEALYDLYFDPNEVYNLVGAPRSATVLQEMRARLEAWMQGTDDPLLQGPIPAPPGAVLEYPNALSPT